MATFTVTNLFDSGSGSLRNAIFQANTASTTDDISFNPSLSGGTIGLTSGELRIRDDLTINGLGADLLSVDAGGNSFRVFNVDDGDDSSFLEVAIKGLTITGGNTEDFGGGINNSFSSLTVTNSTISGNSASRGGGIYNGYGSLTVTNSTISGNTAEVAEDKFFTGSGGGIYNSYSSLTVTNSTISGNTAGEDGGGINSYMGRVTVTNSTISGNTAGDDGGGIDSFRINGSALTVNNSTISGNTAGDGGGISASIKYYGVNTVTGSIIAANSDAANSDNEDIGFSFASGGNNLIGNGDGTGGFTNGVNGDLVGTATNPIDPLLGELQNNGGPTQTQALLAGSPAINAGSNPLGLEFDQRGPGFNRVVGAQTDIGAYEVVPEPDSTLGVLGVAVLGVVLLRKRQRLTKTKA